MATPTHKGPRPHVVIVGGGFGGLYAAKTLARHAVDITVIDKENYHLFQPLLYQVATAALSTGDIASPIRSILRRYKNVRVRWRLLRGWCRACANRVPVCAASRVSPKWVHLGCASASTFQP